MIRIWLLILFISYAGLAGAQTIIKGIITSKTDGKPIAGIGVMVKEKQTGSVLVYSRTDNQGVYLLNFNSKQDSLLFTASGFNIAQQNRLFINRSQELSFELMPQVITLKEIKVNPPKIRKLNDTITYLVDGFKDNNDRTIGDVLKKMPGITVKDDGSILYNNKPINKFYIESKDMLQGRYGIATNNIEAKDVATVEVLENHQPVKALRNREFSDDPALNIKLKEDAKGILTANAQLGTGVSPLLWNNELTTLYFNKNRQNIDTYKGNNTGNDPGRDFTSYYLSSNSGNAGSSLALQAPAVPPISQKHYLFNQAHAFSINNLWAGKKNNQLTANISYLKDRQQKSSNSVAEYYLPKDSILTIREKMASTEIINQVNADLQFNKNSDDLYLDNTFALSGKFNKAEGIVSAGETVFQQLNTPLYSLSNTLDLVKNHRKSSFKVSSYTALTRAPQTLNVQPVLYNDLFSGLNDPVSMRQELIKTQFSSKTNLSFSINNEHWKQNYAAGLNINLQQFTSGLQEQDQAGELSPAADSLSNWLRLDSYQAYINTDYTYVFKKFRITAGLPLNYNYLYSNDQFAAGKNAISRVFFNPTLFLKYDLNLFMALTANAKYTQQLGEIDNIFSGYVMQSYRSLVRNDGELPEQKNQTYSVSWSYRHPIKALFASLNTGYFSNKSNLAYSYDYQGILSVKKTYHIPVVTNGYYLNGNMNKGIDAINGNFTFDIGYSNTMSAQFSQNQLIHFSNEVYHFKPGLLSKIGKAASVSYSYQFAQSRNAVKNDDRQFKPIRSDNQRIKLSLFPAKGLIINLEHEYFYAGAAAAGNKTMSFADAGIKYRYKNIEYSIDYNNIFNAREYVFASYNEISSYYSVYALRPAQVLMRIRFKIK